MRISEDQKKMSLRIFFFEDCFLLIIKACSLMNEKVLVEKLATRCGRMYVEH
jgi:hypothetical protein